MLDAQFCVLSGTDVAVVAFVVPTIVVVVVFGLFWQFWAFPFVLDEALRFVLVLHADGHGGRAVLDGNIRRAVLLTNSSSFTARAGRPIRFFGI